MNRKLNSTESAIKVCQSLNYKLHSEQLNVPILNDMKVIKIFNPKVILFATNGQYTEHLVSDGPLYSNETFEQRVNLIIETTKLFMKDNNCENIDNCYKYLSDYSNNVFNFKIYVQDIVVKNNDEQRITRQFNAFFLEPHLNDIYQISLSAGPYNLKKVDINDIVTKNLNNMFYTILDNIKYKN